MAADERFYFVELGPRQWREPTEQELRYALDYERRRKDIERLKAELDASLEDCQHTVKYDEQGYIYDVRYCLACGKALETI